MRNFKFARCFKKSEEYTPAYTKNNMLAEMCSVINSSSNDSSVTPCEQWEEKLISTHRDDLSHEERIELEKHLEECSSCSAIRRYDRVMDSLIRQLPFRELSASEPQLELPPQLKRLWEFEDMQKRLPQAEEIEKSLKEQNTEDVLDDEVTFEEKTARPNLQLKKMKMRAIVPQFIILWVPILVGLFSMVFVYTMVPLGVFIAVTIVAGIMALVIVVFVLQHIGYALLKRGKSYTMRERRKLRQTLKDLVLL